MVSHSVAEQPEIPLAENESSKKKKKKIRNSIGVRESATEPRYTCPCFCYGSVQAEKTGHSMKKSITYEPGQWNFKLRIYTGCIIPLK